MPSRLGLLGVSGPTVVVPTPPAGFTPASVYGLETWYYQPDIDYAAGTWVDRSGNSRNLTQATAGSRPTLSAALAELNGKYGVGFDSVDDFIQTAGFTLTQPETILSVLRQRSWSAGRIFYDGVTDLSGVLQQITATPQLRMYAGTALGAVTALPLGRFGQVTTVFNTTASGLTIGGARQATGAAGSGNMGGVTLGYYSASGGADAQFSEHMVYRGVVGAYDLVRLWNEWIAADRYNIPVTFNPTSITGCQLWLRGSDLGAVDSAISSWPDQSGNSRNATQGTGANQPVVKIGSNGKKVAQFDGLNDSLSLPNFMTGFTSGMLIAVVRVNVDPPPADGTRGDVFDTGVNGHYAYSGGGLYPAWGSSAQKNAGAHPLLNQYRVYEIISAAGDYRVYLDGVLQFSTGTNTVSFGSAPQIGRSFDTFWLFGQIAEIIVYNSVLTDAQRQQVEGYLANTYAINAAIRPFDPLSVTGCKAWWNAAYVDTPVDGSAISTLYDISGNGNHLTQATGSAKPTYRATTGPNSKPCADFDGGDSLARIFPTPLVQPNTFFAVFQLDTATGVLTDNTGGGAGRVFATYGDPWQIDAGVGLVHTAVRRTGEWVLSEGVFNGASSRNTIDGITVNGNAGTNSWDGVTMSGNWLGGNPIDGRVAEFIIYNANVLDADRASVRAWLCKKYDIGYKAPNHASLLANLAGWWDASQETAYADGAAVSSITDKSGNARHAVQAVSANQPVFKTSILNGRPVYRFTTNDFCKTPTFTINQPYTAFLVAKATSATPGAYRYAIGATQAADPTKLAHIGINSSNNFFVGANTETSMGAADVNWNLFSFIGNGASGLWAKNGVRTTANLGTSVWEAITIGSRGDGLIYWEGDIAEVIVYNYAMSDADRRAVENGLAQKYNIAV